MFVHALLAESTEVVLILPARLELQRQFRYPELESVVLLRVQKHISFTVPFWNEWLTGRFQPNTIPGRPTPVQLTFPKTLPRFLASLRSAAKRVDEEAGRNRLFALLLECARSQCRIAVLPPPDMLLDQDVRDLLETTASDVIWPAAAFVFVFLRITPAFGAYDRLLSGEDVQLSDVLSAVALSWSSRNQLHVVCVFVSIFILKANHFCAE